MVPDSSVDSKERLLTRTVAEGIIALKTVASSGRHFDRMDKGQLLLFIEVERLTSELMHNIS